MLIVDKRTEKQKETHTEVFGGYLTNYGTGNDMRYWACRPDESDSLKQWLDAKSGLSNIREGITEGHYTDRAIIKAWE